MAKASQELTIEDLKKLLQERDRQLEVLQKENNRLKSTTVLMQEFGEAFIAQCKEKLDLGENLPIDQVKCMLDVLASVSQNLSASRTLRAHFEKGNESMKAVSPAKATSQEQAEGLVVAAIQVENQLQRCLKAVNAAKTAATAERASTNEVPQDEAMTICTDYYKGAHLSQKLKKQPIEPKGRQASKASLATQTQTSQGVRPIVNCKDCGNETFVWSMQEEKFKGLHAEIGEGLVEFLARIPLQFCTACNRAHALIASDAAVPTLPNQTVAQNVLIDTIGLMCNGVPANRVETIWLQSLCLGSDTLSRLLLQWGRYYGKPLCEALMAAVKHMPVLLADETPYDCLASEGRGSSKALEKACTQSYVLTLGSANDADTPFVSYHYLPSRSRESIAAPMTQWQMQPEVLVTDGYGAYPGIAAQELSAQHQSCMVHFRREVLKALDLNKFLKEVGKLSEKEENAFWKQKLINDSKTVKLLTVAQMISDLYSYENEVKREPEETLESYYKRVAKNRSEKVEPLMEKLDIVMRSMSEELTQRKKTGKYEAKVKNNAYAAAVVYYMNQRDSLRYFLQDPRVPCDTNKVERAIRPLTILRKNAYFTQSVEGMENLCTFFTLYETSRLNGVDFYEWLTAYGRALFTHCYEAGWTQELRNNPGKDISKKIMKWNFEALAEGFNFSEWLPWNYKKRTA